jgi:hypothetical protein
MILKETKIDTSLGTCLLYFTLIFELCLDIFGDYIGKGTFAMVYKSLFKKKNDESNITEVAIKVFFPQENPTSIIRDLQNGCDIRLNSKYTIIYNDIFDAQDFRCASMPLMKTSLQKHINSLPNKFMKDEV